MDYIYTEFPCKARVYGIIPRFIFICIKLRDGQMMTKFVPEAQKVSCGLWNSPLWVPKLMDV